MNNPIVRLLRASRLPAAEEGPGEATSASWTTEGCAELGGNDYPRKAAALRALCFALVAVVLGMGALLLAHDGSQAQATPQDGGVEAWLPIPYPRTPDMPDCSSCKTYTDGELAALMDKAVSAGASGVEIEADWWILEPQQDRYRWQYTDRFVSFARARGLKVGFQITQAPVWATGRGGWDAPRTQTELALWGAFVEDLVGRYGTRVARYKMWNEPNHPTFWAGGSGPNPAEYARLLREGYLAAKRADPSVEVTCCSLSHNDIGYLNTLYTEIRKYPDAQANDDFFDELSVHPYSSRGQTQTAPGAPEYTFQHTFGLKNTNFWGYRKMREVMVAHGDSHKQIYLGEFGYNTGPAWTAPITDAQRAVWLKEAFAIADQDAGYLSGLDWYSYYSDSGRGFNIVDPNTLAESATFKALREVNDSSTITPPPPPPPPPSVETLSFLPVADARVEEQFPNSNFGSASTLIADADSRKWKLTLLKFDVSGIGARAVQSASLRLYVTNGGGSSDGPAVRRSASSWTEGGVTWNTRPYHETLLQGDKGVVASSSWMTFDVTNLVRGDGTVTLTVQPTSKDGTYMEPREGSFKPQLVLTLGG